MHLYKSSRQNLIHYVTTVTHDRIPYFQHDLLCDLFLETVRETKKDHPFKLIGFVIMPDHVHLLLNPIDLDIRKLMNLIKGRSSRRILEQIRRDKRGRVEKFWQKGFSSVDLYTHRFILQKVRYLHLNPVRAGLVATAAEWKYSSYGAGLAPGTSELPLEVDLYPFWTEKEFEEYESRPHP